MLNFFNQWSAAIQAIMVIAMVIVTSFYAWRTHRMAKIMALELEFNQMPLLVIERDVTRCLEENNDKKIQLKFSLRNVGKVPIKYITSLLTLNGKDINPPQSGAILIPGQNGSTFSNN
jgi:hypothetical protein